MSTIGPSPLFKYREDSERTEQIFTTGKVWLPTASTLNDPLECRTGQIPDQWKRERVREMENAQMAGFVMSATPALDGDAPFHSLSSRATKRWFKRLRAIKGRKEKYAVICRFLQDQGSNISRPSELFDEFERQLSRVGIFSLSECADNQLMWAHYASSHSGLAVGFGRTPGSKLASAEHTLKVIYSNRKPTFEGGFINEVGLTFHNAGMRSQQKISFGDPTFRAAFTTKPEDWSYEREWRYVEEASGAFPWPGPIEEIVFGLKLPHNRRLHYAALVSNAGLHTVRFYEMKVASGSGSLEVAPWNGRPM